MTHGNAFLVINYCVLTALRTNTGTGFVVFGLTDLAISCPAPKTEPGEEVRNSESSPIAFLAVAEALIQHELMLNADVLETGPAFIAFRLFPGLVIGQDRIGSAFKAH